MTDIGDEIAYIGFISPGARVLGSAPGLQRGLRGVGAINVAWFEGYHDVRPFVVSRTSVWRVGGRTPL